MPFRKFYITTLGCKVNQYESQALSEAWSARGWLETSAPENADIIVINSCAVTASAVADVRATARRLNRENPHAGIWLTGCSAQTHAEQMKTLPGVSALIPAGLKDELLNNPEKWLAAETPDYRLPAPAGKRNYPQFKISTYQRARPVLKVQDGCSHRCTYCIVPLARGSSVSRKPDEILAEAQRLLEKGFREIILSGINLSQFRSGSGSDFWDLLDMLVSELAPWESLARFRISSLEPGQLGERALDIFAKSRLICPQLHISLQSGSESVLERMGRGHYQPRGLAAFCEKLYEIWPMFGLGADILTGFPGETDAEFEDTVELVKKLPLTYAHVFPFSPRPGTPAAGMPGQLGKELSAERARILRQIVEDKKNIFLDELIKREASLKILLESRETGLGVSEHYVECKLETTHEAAQERSLVTVRAAGRDGSRLLVTSI